MATEERFHAERARVNKTIINQTVVRDETATYTFKGVDTGVNEDSGSDEDTDVTSNPRLNKKGDGHDKDDNLDKEFGSCVKDVNKVCDVTRGEDNELQVQTKFNKEEENNSPPFDKK